MIIPKAPSAGIDRRKRLATGIMAVLLLTVFAVLAGSIPERGSAAIDEPLIQAVRSQASPIVAEIAMMLTFWGSAPAFIALAFLATIILRQAGLHPARSFLPAFAITGAWIINSGMKHSFQRLRPDSMPLVAESGFSFPSAHAMLSLGFYGALAYIVWKNTDSAAVKGAVLAVSALFIAAIGWTRIYLGVHYPSDVAAGFAAGGLWLMICAGMSEEVIKYGCRQECRRRN